MKERLVTRAAVAQLLSVASFASLGLGCNGTLHFGSSSEEQLTVDGAAPLADAAPFACESAEDCPSVETCVPSSHTCAQRCAEGATEHNCPVSAPTCNEVALYCVACTSDAQCAAITDDGERCNLQTGKCVECVDDGDCPSGGHCDLAESSCD